MWRFVRWQVFLWRYREQMYRAVMEDDSRARRLVNSEAAKRRLPLLRAAPGTLTIGSGRDRLGGDGLNDGLDK